MVKKRNRNISLIWGTLTLVFSKARWLLIVLLILLLVVSKHLEHKINIPELLVCSFLVFFTIYSMFKHRPRKNNPSIPNSL